MVDMALLVADASRLEGPQAEILHVLHAAIYDTIKANTDLTRVQVDELTMRCLVRLQSRLAARGYVVRDI